MLKRNETCLKTRYAFGVPIIHWNLQSFQYNLLTTDEHFLFSNWQDSDNKFYHSHPKLLPEPI